MDVAGFDVESSLRTLFRRCVICPTNIVPSCKCAADQTCVLSSQSCSQCPSTSCIQGLASSSTSSQSSSSKGPNTGAIAGGVVGGIAAIVIMWLLWRFCVKGRRQQQELEEDAWATSGMDPEKRERFTMQRDARSSTHTVGSVASTVFTRASNIIQIAYIPGVTNRSPPASPGLLPPVPPLPVSSNTSAASTPSYQQDQHFFMPGDLRDSTYSGISDGRSIRTSVTPSLARSSFAATIYRNNAIVEPIAAQTGVRGRANMVSVKPSPNPSLSPVPPVPVIDYQKHGQKGKNSKESGDAPPPSPAFSIGSTFLSSTAETAMAITARPVEVKPLKADKPRSGNEAELATFVLDDLGIRPERPRVSVATAASSHSRARRSDILSTDLDDTDEETHSRCRRSLVSNEDKRDSRITEIDDTPSTAHSPFSDVEIDSSPDTPQQAAIQVRSLKPMSGSSPTKRISGPPQAASSTRGALGVVMEEAAKPANNGMTQGRSGHVERGPSPFGDENEIESEK